MKRKLLTGALFIGTLVVSSFVGAKYSESSSRTTKSRGANFQARLVNGNVKMSRSKFGISDGFNYYKVIRSQTKSNPVYPEDGYIMYNSDRGMTSYTDTDAPSGTNYYRICAIMHGQKRYCSNVAKLVIKEESSYQEEEKDTTYQEEKTEVTKETKKTETSTTVSNAAVDSIANAFITQLNTKYGSDQASKNKVIDSVVSKLDQLAKQKPVLKSLVTQLKAKLLTEKDDLLDIQNILKIE